MTPQQPRFDTPPTITEEAWQAFKSVSKGKTFAAVFVLTDDEKELRVKATVEPFEGSWHTLEGLFDPQEVCWAAVSFPYKTTAGGVRSKFMYISWVPDTLKRTTFKETIRIKSIGIMRLGELSKAFAKAGASRVQANDHTDLELSAVLQIAAKFERDEIDPASIHALEGEAS